MKLVRWWYCNKNILAVIQPDILRFYVISVGVNKKYEYKNTKTVGTVQYSEDYCMIRDDDLTQNSIAIDQNTGTYNTIHIIKQKIIQDKKKGKNKTVR